MSAKLHGSRAPNRRIMRRYCDFMRQLSAFQSGGSVHFGATMFHKSLMSKSINLFDESGTERERESEQESAPIHPCDCWRRR